MCVLQPCPNPTEPGVWWRDDTQWCLYSQTHQRQIRSAIAQRLSSIDLGIITSSVHPTGARYTANLREMMQVAVASSQRRPIMVINATGPLPIASPPQPIARQLPGPSNTNRVSANVHFRDRNGQLQQYPPGVAQALMQALSSGTQHSLLVRDTPSGTHYLFDLVSMNQYVVAYLDGGDPILSDEAPVSVVIEIPWNPTAMASLAMNADAKMRREILVMIVERCRSDEHLDSILPAQAHPKTIQAKSLCPLSAPGQPVYEEFLESLDAAVSRCEEGVLGNVIKQIQTVGSRSGSHGLLQLAFKPAEPAPVGIRTRSGHTSDSVLSYSVGKAKASAAFWTSMMAPVAAASAVLGNCASQLRILVFLVILPASHAGPGHQTSTFRSFPQLPCSSYVQVDKPEHRLQLAEVIVH